MKFHAIHFMVLELFQAGRDGKMDMAKLNGTILKRTTANIPQKVYCAVSISFPLQFHFIM